MTTTAPTAPPPEPATATPLYETIKTVAIDGAPVPVIKPGSPVADRREFDRQVRDAGLTKYVRQMLHSDLGVAKEYPKDRLGGGSTVVECNHRVWPDGSEWRVGDWVLVVHDDALGALRRKVAAP